MESQNNQKKFNSIPVAIIISGVLLSGAIVYRWSFAPEYRNNVIADKTNIQNEKNSFTQTASVVLPVVWGEMGLRLATSGAIDVSKLKAVYADRGDFPKEFEKLLLYKNENKLEINEGNAGYLLNLFWALGLSNNNPILDSGEMMDLRYGGPQGFASTAGWTIARDNPMDHYSKHRFVSLTEEQQIMVDRMSKGIYRPCCNNSTHFPDCNHGMAMLGLLELMASQGMSESQMWDTALIVNSYWFPDTYMTIASYMKDRGIDWKDVNPKEVLGINYSSASGYSKIASQVSLPNRSQGGSGCGVDTGGSVQTSNKTSKKQVDCGV